MEGITEENITGIQAKRLLNNSLPLITNVSLAILAIKTQHNMINSIIYCN
jgi:hypothetical protein